MRPWLDLLKALLALGAGYLSFLQTQKLIAAGEAQAIASALRAADEEIAKAKAARSRVAADLAADPDRLREPDEFSRD